MRSAAAVLSPQLGRADRACVAAHQVTLSVDPLSNQTTALLPGIIARAERTVAANHVAVAGATAQVANTAHLVDPGGAGRDLAPAVRRPALAGGGRLPGRHGRAGSRRRPRTGFLGADGLPPRGCVGRRRVATASSRCPPSRCFLGRRRSGRRGTPSGRGWDNQARTRAAHPGRPRRAGRRDRSPRIGPGTSRPATRLAEIGSLRDRLTAIDGVVLAYDTLLHEAMRDLTATALGEMRQRQSRVTTLVEDAFIHANRRREITAAHCFWTGHRWVSAARTNRALPCGYPLSGISRPRS